MKKTLCLLLAGLVILGSSSLRATAEEGYTINPGDVLQITVWKEDGLDREILVLPDGSISFPLVGSLSVRGLTPGMLQAELKRRIEPMVHDAYVTVAVKAALGNVVDVIGQVTKPGEIVLSHVTTVMQALSMAGGLTPYASHGAIIVLQHVNGQEKAVHIPYDDIASGNSLDKDLVLTPGDVVVVPTATLNPF